MLAFLGERFSYPLNEVIFSKEKKEKKKMILKKIAFQVNEMLHYVVN